ncbi:Ser-Asp rich fibrinogen-binding, bone sialoprotein-binding protein [Natrinema limicola JCM 13563]|uniref:Ser-Asp rich fibrinogen-binding, bone sialoprotein-binding protein n=1 Tax=Natrinema limicola JCM 13563 TaxID=1230457 RepID=M0CG80_9EURY|nr:Ser-Asp rich fibrinogen-binding, bone sialoprotein-binding protein [Natrinema limicola JCM 13563]
MVATVGLSGCVEALQEHYEGSFRGVVPVEIYSEANQPYDVTLEAFKPETDRQTYDESFTITAGQRATAPHLEATEQRFRVTKIDREDRTRQLTKEERITPRTNNVTVRITDDDLILELERDDEESGAVAEPDSVDSNSSDTGTSTNESVADR